MAKRSRKNIDRVIAIVAGLVLAFGLVPVTASAAGEGPDGPGGQAPNISKTVAAAGPEAPPAPTGKAGDNAAKGDKTGDNGAQDGAGASGKDPGETGGGKADVPAGGNGVGTPVAAPADDGAAGGGKAEAPAEGAGESASDTPTEGAGAGEAPDAGGGEGKGGPAVQTDNPGKAGDPEQAAPAAEDGAAAANAQAAQPAAQAEDAATGAKAQLPAFRQSRTVGGVTVAVEAGAGAFPESAGLSVASVPSSATEAAVAPERDENENVAASYTFDIKVLGADGAELQPAGGRSVRVSFAAAEVADPNLETSVYHVSGGEAEELAVSESGSTATATSDGFSFYTVEFTYGELQYVLPGGESVPLADVLAEVGLQGEPTAAESSAPDLFAVGRDASGAWTVSARRAFSSTETLAVTINGAEYAIAVTDEQAVDGGDCGDGVFWELTGQGDDLTLTIRYEGGTGKMADYENHTQLPWNRHRLDIRAVAIGQGVTSIGNSAFESCASLKSVTIPSSVTSIGDSAFSGCIEITSVVIPESVTSIGASAFAGCDSLKSFAIGQGVTSIEENAFYDCANLDSVTIPKSVTAIHYHAFFRCPKLRRLDYGGTFKEWDSMHKHEKWASGTPSDMVVVCGFDGTVGHSPDGGGEASARVEVSHNDAQPLATAIATATPNEGYVFESWTEGGEVVSDKATYSFPQEKHTDLTANFRIPLTITARGQTLAYSGQIQGEGDTVYGDPAEIAEKFEVEGLRPGDTLESVTLDGQGKDAGGYELVPSNAAIGGDNAGDYAIAYVPGTLTIEPAAATVATGSATKAYDGEALTNAEASITGLVNGETAAVTATGSQTEVGSSPNTYSIDWGSAKAENYTVTERLGTLTVEAAPAMKGTLTFDLAGGTLDGKTGKITVEANVGDTIKLPGAPTKKGYAFKFWKGSEYAAGAEYKVEGDHTFTAVWEAEPAKPSYRVASGEGSAYVEGSGAPLAFTFERTVDPEKAFAHFTGIEVDGEAVPRSDASGKANWTARSGSVIVELQPSFLETLPAGAHTVAALFDDGDPAVADFKVSPAPAPAVHTVAFDANGHGKAPGAQEVEHGGKAKRPADPTADGWTFGGWYKDEECKSAYDFSAPVTEDVTLYAKWTRKSSPAPAPAVHTVAFDANGHGKAPGAQEVEHGGKAKRPADPTADGWTFGGWYKDEECKSAYDFSAPVTEDITLYAKWTRKSSSGSGTSPKTGDPLAGAFATALALVAASALALAASRRRRRG